MRERPPHGYLPSTTSAAFIRHLLDVARVHGVAERPLLAQVGLEPAQLQDPVARLPLASLRKLLSAAAEACGLPHFGLAVGAAVRPASYSGLGYVAMTSATLGESLSMIPRFGKIVFDSPSSRTQVSAAAGLITVADRRISEIEPYSIGLVEATLCGWVAFGRWLTGDHTESLAAVHMMHAEPPYADALTAFFGCLVHYEAGQNALLLPELWLQKPVLGADPAMHKVMLLEAQMQLDRSYASFSVRSQLRALLFERLPYGEARLEPLAEQLGLSPRALQRRLAAEGQRFSGVLESVRMELARNYLGEPGLGVLDVALMLGYSNASAFSHAFRRACGVAPAEYRQSLALREP